MSLATNVTDLATRVATESKALRTLINGNASDLSSLTTTNKASLVAALNELQSAMGDAGASIDDVTASGATTYSSTKINSQIAAAISALATGAPAALDTLDELAAALGDDANFSATVTTALGNRVRTDTPSQGLNGTQQTNARTNILAASSVDVGNTATDFVATFNSGLV